MTKELEEQLKEIAKTWLGCSFLKQFKELGEKFSKQIKEEK